MSVWSEKKKEEIQNFNTHSHIHTPTQSLSCPECGNEKFFKDGLRELLNGEKRQRYICRLCGHRYTRPSSLNAVSDILDGRQISAAKVKNLPNVPKYKRIGTGELNDETKALLKVFEGWMQKEGYKKNRYVSNLITLVHIGANLSDPEDVKAKIAAHTVKDGMKMMLCYSYEAFLKMQKLTWERPTYKQDEIIPFIPEENELDQLIAAAHSKRMVAYLQTLKETYTDPGEALAIEWKDIQEHALNINHPCKGHRARTLEVSDKLVALLNMLPRLSERVFNCQYSAMCTAFITLKKRVAANTRNERIKYIEMRSFRHWGGTMIAQMSNGNPISVMKMLGHKSVTNSMKYVNIYKLSFRTETEYESLSVTTPEELKVALLGGYQFVIEKFGASWFRRPKRIAFAGTPIDQRELQVESLMNKGKPEGINAF
jgi:integrase